MATATDKVMATVDHFHETLLSVEIKLSLEDKPSITEPAGAEATIDVNGTVIRAHQSAETPIEAVDRLSVRLRQRLARFKDRREAGRRRGVTPQPWRDDGEPFAIGPPSPNGDGELVRRKAITLTPTTSEAAIDDMDRMDHPFWLYLDRETGDPRVVHRATNSHAAEPGSDAVIVDSEESFSATMSIDDAVAALDRDYAPFVLFQDGDPEQHQLLYRRRDGDYGLLVATVESD